MSEFTDALAQFDDVWQEIPEDTGENKYADLPDGIYQAFINEVEIGESKKGNRLQLKWDLIAVAPEEFKNRHIFRYSGLESKENLEFLKRDLGRCGINLEKISELPNVLPELLDKVVEVQLKTKTKGTESYQNSYINKLLGMAHEGEVGLNEGDLPW
jgi:hypothetical protein